MDDATLTIEVDRTSLGLGPLVMLGHGTAAGLAVSDYSEPAMQARVEYAPDSGWVHGSVPLSAVWQQGILGFTVFTDQAPSEGQSRAWLAELRVALIQLSYVVTVTVNGAAPEQWRCTAGSMTPAGGRTREDLRDANPKWSVSIPCHPIRQIV